MARQITSDNTRKKTHKRIQEALAKKPTAAHLNRAGLTSEEIQKQFGNAEIPNKTEHRINNRTGRKINGRRRQRRPGIRNPTPVGDFIPPANSQLTTPDWFTAFGHKDISVIVPLYQSRKVVEQQIASWDVRPDGLKKEVIYVDDSCPMNSHRIIVETWAKRKGLLSEPVGKLIRNYGNGGFGFACNTGAKYAEGDYLVFLNADTTVSPNWIKPMYDIMANDPKIGIVGNMQLNKDNLDSAGSEWSWESRSFLHIGRNSYHGKMLPRACKADAIPKDLKQPGEREMVTGCCFMIRRDLFNLLQGFDLDFRIGYWEDADLCMRVKNAGYKIWYTPKSVIHHDTGHSKSHGHEYMKHNRDLFDKRWVRNGKMDLWCERRRPIAKLPIVKKEGKVYGCVIACNEEEFLEASVESLSPVVDHWLFVIGGNEYAYKAGMCDNNGYPTDSTLSIAYDLCSRYGGNVIEPPGRLWKDKVEMRNAYAEKLQPGDWMWMLDGDEVYKPEAITTLVNLMSHYDVFIYNFFPFWNNMNTIGTGKWDQYPQERLVRWHNKFMYRGKNHLAVTSTDDGRTARSTHRCYKTNDRMFYHYTWVRPIEKIRQKLETAIFLT